MPCGPLLIWPRTEDTKPVGSGKTAEVSQGEQRALALVPGLEKLIAEGLIAEDTFALARATELLAVAKGHEDAYK